MRGDEALVVRDFQMWLESEGWSVEVERDHWDVVGRRNGETLYCEAKGRTSEPGLDVHTAYGQILCRQPSAADQDARYSLVIRDEPRSLRAAVRAPAWVRTLLRVTIYAVADDGAVRVVR